MTGCFYPHLGGLVTDVYEISSRLVKMGYETDIVVCNTKKAAPHEQLEGMNIYRLDSWNMLHGEYAIPQPTLRNFRILGSMLKKEHNLVHVYTRFYINSSLGLLISRLKGVPLLYTELGVGHVVSSSKLVSLLARTYDHSLGTLLVKSANKVVVICQASIPFLRHLGLRKAALAIPFAVNETIFKRSENNLRERLGLEKAIVVTSACRLIYAKGVQDLILAYPRIKREIPAARILIVGSGEYETELKTLARTIDEEGIRFLGGKSAQEVAQILSITDIAVSTSYSEGLSASVLEASAMGLPVVATNVGGTPEIIQDQETGMLFEPGDVGALAAIICQVAKNKDLAKKLGDAARQATAEKFNWDHIVQCYSEVIDSMSQKSGG